ncbi:epidermal growth factor receptor-like [Glandiceps talaboti]
MAELAGLPVPTMDWHSSDAMQALKKFKQMCELYFNGPLTAKTEAEKCNYLQIWSGEVGIDIVTTWNLTTEEKTKLATYWNKFEEYVAPKSNFRLARYKLRTLKQQPVCPGLGHSKFESFDEIDKHNINMFSNKNCTTIDGSIVITQSSIDGTPLAGFKGVLPTDLEVFSTVKKITGHLVVLHGGTNEVDLSAFRNLEVISGQDLFAGYAIFILGTNLRSLGMASLREISRGNVFVRHNFNMCYVTSNMFNGILIDPNTQTANVGRNGQRGFCQREGAICHEECTDVGCWGPGASECMECKHVSLGNECVKQCLLDQGQYMVSDKECGYCDTECTDSCTGPGANDCNHQKDAPTTQQPMATGKELDHH